MNEIEQLKADIKELGSIIECKNGTIATLAKTRDKLKAENARLKEEIEIRDNLSEKFRKEALSWANIANEYQKDKTKLEQTLQEIKAIAENRIKGCVDCNLIAEPYECVDCTDGGMAKLGKKILDLITKAESEG